MVLTRALYKLTNIHNKTPDMKTYKILTFLTIEQNSKQINYNNESGPCGVKKLIQYAHMKHNVHCYLQHSGSTFVGMYNKYTD